MFKNTWPSWATWVVGLWLVLAPFSLGYVTMSRLATIDDVVLGVVLASVSVWIFTADRPMAGASFAVPFIGIWILAAPFLLDFRGLLLPLVNDAVAGVATVALGLTQVAMFTREKTVG